LFTFRVTSRTVNCGKDNENGQNYE
jgi:hypothetical protein